MAVSVIRTAWAGTSGGPGLTQLWISEASGYFLTGATAEAAVNAVRTFWDSIKAYMPDEVTVTTSPIIDSYNEVNGDLIGSTTASSTPLSVTGTSTVNYAMASGLRVALNTTGIRFGRRVRGSFYVVPAGSNVYNSSGQVASTVRTAVDTAAETMRTTLNSAGMLLVVYSRPREATETVTARNGAFTLVSGCETNEKGAVLRGRRD